MVTSNLYLANVSSVPVIICVTPTGRNQANACKPDDENTDPPDADDTCSPDCGPFGNCRPDCSPYD